MDCIPGGERRGSTGNRLRPAPSYSRPVTIHYEIQNHATRMQKLTKAFKVYRLVVLTLICVVAGIALGLLSRPYAHNWTERQFMYIELPGELYLRLLKLIIIPLLVSNVILSFGSIQGKLSSHLGKISACLYVGSNLMAISVAVLLVLLMSPGKQLTRSYLNTLGNVIHVDNHHYFNEYHDSIKRYREYHPMFYHTNLEQPQIQATPFVKLQNFILAQTPSETATGRFEEGPKQNQPERATDGSFEGPTLNRSGHLVGGKVATINQSSNCVSNEVHRAGLSTKLPIDVLLDVLRNLIPDSLVGATMLQTRTRLFAPKELLIAKDGSTEPPPSRWPMGHEMVEQANIIGLLAISVLTGVMLSHMAEASKPLLDLCACISEVSLRIGMMTINLMPICIMFLLVGQVARARDLNSIAGELCMYSLTVLLALFVHGFVLLPLAYYLITKKSPIAFFFGLLEALVAAFATSSSSATMALTLNCLAELDLNPVVVRAFGPLGSVFNMNGTAIYEAIGAIFISQTLGVTLPLTSILLVGLGSAVASLSTAGIPSSGVMTMVIVLNAINLPVLQLSLIYIVDFIIDRFRTVANVWSGAVVCGLINHFCPEQMFEDELKPEKYHEMARYHRMSRGTLGGVGGGGGVNNNKNFSDAEENYKPQVISVTITPPSESSL